MRWHMFSARWNRDTGVGGVMGNEVEAISCSWNRHLTDSWKKWEMQMGNLMADRPLAAVGYGVRRGVYCSVFDCSTSEALDRKNNGYTSR